MKSLRTELSTYTELHWWNMGKKTTSFKGQLKELLDKQNISYSKRKTEHDGLFNYTFKSSYGISYKVRGSIGDFRHYAKQAIQMELVRMGDKAQLYVQGSWRPTVTVNH